LTNDGFADKNPETYKFIVNKTSFSTLKDTFKATDSNRSSDIINALEEPKRYNFVANLEIDKYSNISDEQILKYHKEALSYEQTNNVDKDYKTLYSETISQLANERGCNSTDKAVINDFSEMSKQHIILDAERNVEDNNVNPNKYLNDKDKETYINSANSIANEENIKVDSAKSEVAVDKKMTSNIESDSVSVQYTQEASQNFDMEM